MSAKVLVIGWDSADKDLLLQWSQSGELPTIDKLRKKGLWGNLRSPVGMGDDATWASFYSGVSPAKHGRFFTHQIWPGSYEPVWFEDFHLRHEPFWEGLSRANKKVAVLDVPKCTLSKNLNGIQLVDWLVHGSEHPEVCSWPHTLVSDIVADFGKAPRCLCGYSDLPISQFGEFFNRLRKGIELKTDLYLSLLDQDNWDLFLGVFKESHCVGHHCWHFGDFSHPAYRPDLVQQWGNPIKHIYQTLDASLGRILDRVEDDTTVILFSNLGMGPNYTGNTLLPEVLKRLEGFPRTSGQTGLGVFRKIWKQVPMNLRKPLSKKLGHVNKHVSNFEKSLPRFFAVPHNEISGAVRINLQGREPNGRVHPGKEYDTLCETLSNDLLQLICPETGMPLVEKVIRPHDLYHGPCIDNLPDLLVMWNRFRPISEAWSQKTGAIKTNNLNFRSGNHIPDGIMFAYGSGILSGSQIGPVSLLDLPASISEKLGVALPNLDGQPIPELTTP